MEYCSPKELDNYKSRKSCYNRDILEKIAEAYNRSFPDNKIETIEKLSFSKLWKTLQKRMKTVCDDNEVCWVSQVGLDYDKSINKFIRPKMPNEWIKNPNEWLSNFNIEAVLIQYQQSIPEYKWIGVFPVDFNITSSKGECLYSDVCSVDIQELYHQGYKYCGLIINLDKHDQPGSHWTSLFICIDPSLKCFGAHYFDSVGNNPPFEMKSLMENLKTQGEELKKKIKSKNSFELNVNKIQYQYGNSECGIFSIYYQLKWLNLLKNLNNRDRNKLTFDDVIKNKITDKQIESLRKILFRPIFKVS